MELAPEVTSVGCLGKVGLTTKVSGILGILRNPPNIYQDGEPTGKQA